MNHNDTTIVCRKYGNLNNFCKFQLEEGVNAIFKNVGLYLQEDSYTIKLASKLKFRYSTFIRWNGLICRLNI